MYFQQLIFVLFVLAPLCSAHIGGQQLERLQDVSPRIYCGRALARIIFTICSEDDKIGADKRSELGPIYGALIPPYYKEQDTNIGWPWIVSSKARALGSSRGKRVIAGVADECCDKPCRLAELLNYC